MNFHADEVIRRAIAELAQALLYREYGKDMRNHDLIRLLAHEPLEKFAEATADQEPADQSS